MSAECGAVKKSKEVKRSRLCAGKGQFVAFPFPHFYSCYFFSFQQSGKKNHSTNDNLEKKKNKAKDLNQLNFRNKTS